MPKCGHAFKRSDITMTNIDLLDWCNTCLNWYIQPVPPTDVTGSWCAWKQKDIE